MHDFVVITFSIAIGLFSCYFFVESHCFLKLITVNHCSHEVTCIIALSANCPEVLGFSEMELKRGYITQNSLCTVNVECKSSSSMLLTSNGFVKLFAVVGE